MEYKTMKGQSHGDCLQRIRRHYGSDAMIIQTKEISDGGLFGTEFFARKYYEVYFMISEKRNPLSSSPADLPRNHSPLYSFDKINHEKIDSNKLSNSPPPLFQDKSIETNPDKATPIERKPVPNTMESTFATSLNEIPSPSAEKKEFMTRILQLLPPSTVEALGEKSKTSTVPEKPAPYFETSLPNVPNTTQNDFIRSGFTGVKAQLYDVLLTNDFSPAYANSIMQNVSNNIPIKHNENAEVLREACIQEIASRIHLRDNEMPKDSQAKKAIMFIGAPGVGKTTALAKLAYLYTIENNLALSILNLDHHRLGATQQLKTYASVLNMSCSNPTSLEALQECLYRETESLILIDTAGSSISSLDELETLREYQKKIAEHCLLETHLVIQANMHPNMMELFCVKYAEYCQYEEILLSKLDETEYFGKVIEVADKLNKVFSFSTDAKSFSKGLSFTSAEERASRVFKKSLIGAKNR